VPHALKVSGATRTSSARLGQGQCVVLPPPTSLSAGPPLPRKRERDPTVSLSDTRS